MKPKNVTIKINMENAAFGGDPGSEPGAEVARILRDLADKAELNGLYGREEFPARDTNGNKVGSLVAK